MSIFVFVAFALGFFLGYITSLTINKKIEMTPSTFVLVTVFIIWSITRIVDLLDPAFTTPLALDTLAGIIVGFFYKPILKRNDKKDS